MNSNIWDSIDKFAFDEPLLFSIGATFLLLILLVLSIIISALLFKENKLRHLGESIGRIMGSVLLIIMINKLGWLDAVGIKSPGDVKTWGLMILPLIYAVVTFPRKITGSTKLSIENPLLSSYVGLNAASAALIEEISFRAVILYALIRVWGNSELGMFNSVLVSSLLFGLIHLLNLLAGESLVRVIPQFIWSSLGGILFGALVVSGQSIWSSVVFHGAINIVVRLNMLTVPNIKPTIRSMITLDLLAVPIAIYGLILIILSS